MIEIDARGKPPLGMTPARFLREFWQKKPLLVRNAFPDFATPIEPEDLAGLACEELALSRIVEHDRQADRWTLRTGPFAEEEFPGMPDHDWTLLVQDVDKWDADVAAVLPHFDFLPRWRVDDVMISFAAPGGSVGPHVDQYDVFLLQAKGHRRWQIDASSDPSLAFRDDAPIRLLRQFNATHDWVLAPGDMLYLPPGVPHNGVAEDACLTFSIGMRAPSAAELLGDFVDTLASESDDAIRYHDPDLAPARDPMEIDDAAMSRVVEALNALRMNDPERLSDWFGRFITSYRSAGIVAAPGGAMDRAAIEAGLRSGGVLHRNPFSRVAWRKLKRSALLFVAGQSWRLAATDAKRLSAAESVDIATYAKLGEPGRAALAELVAGGHYQPAGDEDE
ncbi:cupin domain-containing protein [Cognatilysobacter lacus]|uniref:Cupin domain-containing protein n=1 Tax=Cognatilysobacter lacus TaxID=1643323 RepID=A0A5D8Z6L3_9GAMM|nr:cupin domain-containing protein [Lysobacter lacus]TZF90605.1 cupin domain-containing protein [Lysobacter lacus]